MKEVILLFIGLAVLSLSCEALRADPLLTANGYKNIPNYLTTNFDTKDYVASGFRARGDTVRWYEITLTCPKAQLWCAQFYYLRIRNASSLHLLEYSPFHCSWGNTLSHGAMLILNDPGEEEVSYEPSFIAVHDCVEDKTKFTQRTGIFPPSKQKKQSHWYFNIKLNYSTPAVDSRSSLYNYDAPWGEFPVAAYRDWVQKNTYEAIYRKPPIEWPTAKPTVYSVLRSVDDFSKVQRCRATDVLNALYCSPAELLHYKSRRFDQYIFPPPW